MAHPLHSTETRGSESDERGDGAMEAYAYSGRSCAVDEQGFLVQHEDWDEEFAEAMAEEVGIHGGLTEEHWKVIRYIREQFSREGECPTVHKTCRASKLFLRDLRRLFPAGYLRGACKLSGITSNDRIVNYYGEEQGLGKGAFAHSLKNEKTYRVDVHGFLVHSAGWDREFASRLAHDMKVPGGLGEAHWKVIHFLRERFEKTGKIPTVYETCEENRLEVEDLEQLFPDGYHRGAVKLAGLRLL